MIHLLPFLVLAQSATQPLPKTGNETLDTLIYVGSTLAGIMGLREGTYWLSKLNERRNGNGGDVLKQVAEIQRETLKELEEFRREVRHDHERIEDQLNELRRQA